MSSPLDKVVSVTLQLTEEESRKVEDARAAQKLSLTPVSPTGVPPTSSSSDLPMLAGQFLLEDQCDAWKEEVLCNDLSGKYRFSECMNRSLTQDETEEFNRFNQKYRFERSTDRKWRKVIIK